MRRSVSAAMGTVELTGLLMMLSKAPGQCLPAASTRPLTMPALICVVFWVVLVVGFWFWWWVFFGLSFFCVQRLVVGRLFFPFFLKTNLFLSHIIVIVSLNH
jgi:hypothetical protein